MHLEYAYEGFDWRQVESCYIADVLYIVGGVLDMVSAVHQRLMYGQHDVLIDDHNEKQASPTCSIDEWSLVSRNSTEH